MRSAILVQYRRVTKLRIDRTCVFRGSRSCTMLTCHEISSSVQGGQRYSAVFQESEYECDMDSAIAAVNTAARKQPKWRYVRLT